MQNANLKMQNLNQNSKQKINLNVNATPAGDKIILQPSRRIRCCHLTKVRIYLILN